ncbi:MAG: RDD family protein [Chloroflexi bacterium]|nr:RDD family protein [Chloroflexota bacterium]
MPNCPNCGTYTEAGQEVCGKCGTSLPQTPREGQAPATQLGTAPPGIYPTPDIGATGPELATIAQRIGAFLLDGVVLSVVGLLVAGFLTSSVLSEEGVFQTVGSLLTVVYLGVLMYLWREGASPGKLLMGIRFVRAPVLLGGQPGEPEWPGLGTGLLREVIGKSVSTIFFFLGYLWLLWDREHQTWHDKIAGTYVIKIR